MTEPERVNSSNDDARQEDHPDGDYFSAALRESRRILMGDIWERGKACDRLGEFALYDVNALNYLLELTGSPEALIRSGAARALAEPAKIYPIAELQLILLLDDCEGWVCRRAAWSLLAVICGNCRVPLPSHEGAAREIKDSLTWVPVSTEQHNTRLMLKCARKSHDPLVRMVAEIGSKAL